MFDIVSFTKLLIKCVNCMCQSYDTALNNNISWRYFSLCQLKCGTIKAVVLTGCKTVTLPCCIRSGNRSTRRFLAHEYKWCFCSGWSTMCPDAGLNVFKYLSPYKWVKNAYGCHMSQANKRHSMVIKQLHL